jgi:hypothetical protein
MDLKQLLPAPVIAGQRPLTPEEWFEMLDEHLDITNPSVLDRLEQLAPTEVMKEQFRSMRACIK